jgi:hypothetical protein
MIPGQLSVVVAQSCVPTRNHVSCLGRKERKKPTARVGATPPLGGVANFLRSRHSLRPSREFAEAYRKRERQSSAWLGSTLPHSTAIVVLPYFMTSAAGHGRVSRHSRTSYSRQSAFINTFVRNVCVSQTSARSSFIIIWDRRGAHPCTILVYVP